MRISQVPSAKLLVICSVGEQKAVSSIGCVVKKTLDKYIEDETKNNYILNIFYKRAKEIYMHLIETEYLLKVPLILNFQ